MNNKLKFSFPEIKIYWIVIAVFCSILIYFDLYIGIFSLVILGYLVFYNSKLMKYKNNNFLVFFDFLDIIEGKFIFDNTRYETTALSICILSDQTF